GTPGSLFATFDREPLAAASLGQVHRATLEDGRPVVVKVQYPGVDDALKSDLENLGVLVKALAKTSRALDGRTYYQELQREFAAELDYQREATLCRAFGEVVSSIEGLRVPHVIEERTASRVLTLEYLPGPTLRTFAEAGPSAEERFRVSRLLVRAIYGPFLKAGWIHSDPHPGNFIVMPNGQLGLVDFGSVKQFSESFVQANRRTLLRALAHDVEDVVQVLRDVGFTLDLPEPEAREVTAEILEIAGRPLRSGHYDFSQCTMASDMRKLGARRMATMLKIRPPQEAVMFFRGTGGCTQNLKMLGAQGDFRQIYRELTSLFPAA
ncbi:MAG TPA: AarF/ABC1/UbiB kinase family protein, partial [Myxococcaceae bacterium]|nr:AarF/ABC1/UbiB kinase family protein [Myxococcaceae bacterium]